LIATDRDYLADVLNRMGRRANTRALPEELPEWKQVDTSAQFWAVRHYDKDGAKTDPTSPLSGLELAANNPDKQAIGLALSYRTQADELTIKYLSANPAAAKIAEESWKPESYALSPRIRAQEEGVIEVLFSRRDLRDSILTLLVLASLGHAIFV
jgi:hypothetical protein